MPFRFRARPGLGPFRANITKRGISSYSVHEGPVTWNSRRGFTLRLLPGLSWTQGRRKRRR